MKFYTYFLLLVMLISMNSIARPPLEESYIGNESLEQFQENSYRVIERPIQQKKEPQVRVPSSSEEPKNTSKEEGPKPWKYEERY